MTYEYLCTACGHAWEAEQSISAAPLTTCPSCHQEAAKRQVSGGAGFILKGGGWYADLYSSSSKSGGDSKSSDAKSTSDTTTTKGDSTAKADKGSSGSSGTSGSGSTGTPTSSTPSGSKATGATSGA